MATKRVVTWNCRTEGCDARGRKPTPKTSLARRNARQHLQEAKHKEASIVRVDTIPAKLVHIETLDSDDVTLEA